MIGPFRAGDLWHVPFLPEYRPDYRLPPSIDYLTPEIQDWLYDRGQMRQLDYWDMWRGEFYIVFKSRLVALNFLLEFS